MSRGADNIISDGEIWFLLASTCFMISRLLELELAAVNITLEQAGILQALKENGGHATSSELEKLTMRQQHSISMIVHRMIRLGLVTKSKKKGEKRHSIMLTDKGQRALGVARFRAIDDVFSRLSDSKKKTLADCLRIVYVKARNLLEINDRPLFLQLISQKKDTGLVAPQSDETDQVTHRNLWRLLSGTGFAISRLRELELEPLGLSMIQSLVLKFINDGGGSTTPGYIQNITMRQHHSVSTLLTRMVRMGLVKRIKGSGSNRFAIVFTEKGRDLFSRMTMYAIEMTIATLTKEQKRTLVDCLTELRSGAREMLGSVS